MLSIEYSIVELVTRGFRYLGSSGFPLQHFGQAHAGHKDGPNAS